MKTRNKTASTQQPNTLRPSGYFVKAALLRVAPSPNRGINFPRINKPEISRWNLHRADWARYSKYAEENVNRINQFQFQNKRFIKLIKIIETKTIPRCHRKKYISCWIKKYAKHYSTNMKKIVTKSKLIG